MDKTLSVLQARVERTDRLEGGDGGPQEGPDSGHRVRAQGGRPSPSRWTPTISSRAFVTAIGLMDITIYGKHGEDAHQGSAVRPSRPHDSPRRPDARRRDGNDQGERADRAQGRGQGRRRKAACSSRTWITLDVRVPGHRHSGGDRRLGQGPRRGPVDLCPATSSCRTASSS